MLILCGNCRYENSSVNQYCINCNFPIDGQIVKKHRYYLQINNNYKVELEKGENLIGRSKNNKINLSEDLQLSRKHLVIKLADNKCTIKDLNSSNGTFLNGSRILDIEYPLKDSDIIKCGNTAFKFIIE